MERDWAMENEYMKRGYLLPKGCKDLTDVVKPENNPKFVWPSLPGKAAFYETAIISWKKSDPLTPLMRQIFVSPHTTVKELAALLGQKPFTIICDLVQVGTFASVDDLIDFKTVSVVARKYGFEAIKAG
jgi:hypothetical protein